MFIKLLASLVVGVFLGAIFTASIIKDKNPSQGESESGKPLYWVAPMDPNYRRDQPGKSPMGMDLIPVYEDEARSNDAGPGTINIAPNVVNNLGVRISDVQYKRLQNEIRTVGYVQYDEDYLIHIHPRVSGWVEKLYVNATGDPVEKGAPLYDLYSPELVNAQEELALAISRKNTKLVEATENRLRALHIPERFINQFEKNPVIQQTITFYSPQNGVVDNLHIREGFFVQPGTNLLSIGALDHVWVEAEIFERQAPMVSIGDKVSMTLDYLPGEVWTGKVDYIYPTLDSKNRTMRARLRFKNPKKKLKPNMFAQVSIHTQSENKTLVVPREALIRTGTQERVVLALGDGAFKSIAVKTGRQDRSSIEILEGLQEGEQVVSSAQFLLDSESSKTSDFKRMHISEEHKHNHSAQVDSVQADSVWTTGEILELMPDYGMVNARHDPIEKWSWPAMKMNFLVSEDVDFETLKTGSALRMKITKTGEGDHVLTAVEPLSEGREK